MHASDWPTEPPRIFLASNLPHPSVDQRDLRERISSSHPYEVCVRILEEDGWTSAITRNAIFHVGFGFDEQVHVYAWAKMCCPVTRIESTSREKNILDVHARRRFIIRSRNEGGGKDCVEAIVPI